MVVRPRELHVRLLVHGEGRRDVEDRQRADSGDVIDGESVADPATAVVADDVERVESEQAHRLHEVLRHRSLAVRRMVRRGRGLPAVAVAPQVGGDDAGPRCERPCHPVPDGVGLRISVQQEHRWPAPADARVDPRSAGLEVVDREAGEELGHALRITRERTRTVAFAPAARDASAAVANERRHRGERLRLVYAQWLSLHRDGRHRRGRF